MADGDQTLKVELTLSGAAMRHLRERAQKLGWTLEAAVADVLEQSLFDYGDYDWGDDPENDPRTATRQTPRPGNLTYGLEDVMADFDAELERRLAAKR